MEEDIKKVESLIDNFRNNRELFYDLNEEDIQAIENVIKAYKGLKEKTKKL